MNGEGVAVGLMGLPPDESAFFQVAQNQSEIAAGLQDLARQDAGRQRSEVQESFQDAELAEGESVVFEVGLEAAGERLGSADQLDIDVEGSALFR